MQGILQKILTIGTILTLFGVSHLFADAPRLIAPSNGASCVDREITLYWHSATGNAEYGVQIAYDAEFQNVLINSTSITDTSYTAHLAYSTTYYWRALTYYVGSDPEIGTAFSFTTRQTPPTLTAPVDALACVFGDLTFSWDGDAEQYCLEISRSANFDTLLIDTCGIIENTLDLTFNEYGQTYYWRVAGIYDTCRTDYSEVRSFVTPQVEPQLLSPANASKGIPLFENSPPFDITLAWIDVEGINSYRIQIAESSSFATPLYDEFIDATTEQDGIANSRWITIEDLALEINTKYYWRVRSVENACEGRWTNAYLFETPFDAIKGINPRNGDACNSLNETFIWTQENAAMTYHLQIFKDAQLTDMLYDFVGLTDTVKTDVLLDQPLFTYYWRVRAEDNHNIGYWSPVKEFTTTQIAPEINAPENNSTGHSLSILLSWVPYGSDTYQLQVAKDSLFTVILLDSNDYSASEYLYHANNYNYQYYWRVRALHDICTSDWSPVQKFKTTLATPELIAPENNASMFPFPPKFEWAPVEGAKYYTIETAEDQIFQKGYNVESYLNDTKATLPLSKYSENMSYYWRVSAENDESKTAWSAVRKFTMGEHYAYIPNLISPENYARLQPVDLTLQWDEAYKATSYDIEVYDSEALENLIVAKTSTENQVNITNLNNYTNYYWRVRSENVMGKSDWSEIWGFKTIDAMYSEGPALLLPENKTQKVKLPVFIKWEIPVRPAAYNVQVSRQADMSNPITDKQLYTNYYYTKDLEYSTRYYWRANAENEAGVGPWSEIYSFTTEDEPVGVKDDEANPLAPKLFPNPVINSAVLSFYTQKTGPVTITVKSLQGKTVDSFSYSMSHGDHRVEIDASEYSAGAYIYIIKSVGETQNGRFVVK